MLNPFFRNHGPINIIKILKILNINSNNFKQQNIQDIKDLSSSTSKDLTFFHSKKYKHLANMTKASFCVTTDNLKNELPKNCTPLIAVSYTHLTLPTKA